MRHGFTLIELLVSVFIATMIFLVGMSMMNGTSQIQRQTAAAVRASETARLFFAVLERDLAGVSELPICTRLISSIPPYYNNEPPPGMAAGAKFDSDAIECHTRSDQPFSTLGSNRVIQYFVNEKEQLCRQSSNFSGGTPPMDLTSPEHAMFDEVRSLTFTLNTVSVPKSLSVTIELFERPQDPTVSKTDASCIPATEIPKMRKFTFAKQIILPGNL